MHSLLPLAFFSMPGGYEWLIIGLIALLLFGKRLPGVAKSLGQAMHEFKSGLSGAASAEDEKETPVKKDDGDTPAP
ncbi:MAG: twin-arginine translocase TatA/TatE family subunit [Planctomycetaceae bacterium]|nr:twin-arginine translocase TatA/TatE family subunit [Planctomycetaceae bacterium]